MMPPAEIVARKLVCNLRSVGVPILRLCVDVDFDRWRATRHVEFYVRLRVSDRVADIGQIICRSEAEYMSSGPAWACDVADELAAKLYAFIVKMTDRK